MRDSIALGGMRVSDVAGGFEVSNHPVKMWFIRRCGTKVDYSKKENKCECVKCSPDEDWEEFMAWIDERRKTIFDVKEESQ